MELAYYPGCSLHQSSEFYDRQTRIVLQKLGINLVEINDWNCCGATSAGKFDDFLAVALPARNIGIAEADGFNEMVIPCSGCYSSSIMAQQKLIDNPELTEEINTSLSKKVAHNIKLSTILEVLLSSEATDTLSNLINTQLNGMVSACYYGCMTRFAYDVPVSDNVENPSGMEGVLNLTGAATVDWSYKTYCCGASAAINDPETAYSLMGKIMKDAVARDANCIVVTCPMCQLNLDFYQGDFCKKYQIEKRLPVFFLTEILGMSMGMSAAELKLGNHFIDVKPLLRELKLL